MSTCAANTLAFPRELRLESITLARIQQHWHFAQHFFLVGCCASKLIILISDHVSSSRRDIYTFRIAFGAFCENFHIGNQLKLNLLVDRTEGIRSIAIKKSFYVPRSKDTRRESRKKRRTFQCSRNYRITSIISTQHDLIWIVFCAHLQKPDNSRSEVRGK